MAGWLKKLFSPSQGQGQTSTTDLPPLTDADFEFLFEQLLQGIARGWQPDRLEVFIADLGVRGKVTAWEAWLERYSTKILAQSPPPQQHLIGTRLLFVGNAFRNSPKLGRFAKAFAEIGQQLVTGRGKITATIWEYDGVDALAETEAIAAPAPEIILDPRTLLESEPTSALAATPTAEIAGTPDAPETIISPTVVEAEVEVAVAAEELPMETETESPIPATTTEMAEASEPKDLGPTIEALFKEGLAKAEVGDFSGAIAAWDQVIAIQPTIAEVWHNRGSALGKQGQYAKALSSLEQACQLAPDNVLIWRDQSYVLMALEQWETALKSWNHTIELRDDMAEAWYQRGLTLEQLHKPENAVINYRRVLSLVPEFEKAQERLTALEGIGANPAPVTEATDPWTD
ncbi:tetratricopeptide repeat protein [Picosynechococcus sp. NKBG15041c]|uniref:tetratricopeptide repeat protein n=1 Tax=Picosynechococcus sp. NKBG15041c TaxID=1407650 RepID=UPI00040A0C04|nr:tetratricopeptide repeat protein [Picosynechococcus sp. NKBG15041c]